MPPKLDPKFDSFVGDRSADIGLRFLFRAPSRFHDALHRVRQSLPHRNIRHETNAPMDPAEARITVA